jgi:hypothetical protein
LKLGHLTTTVVTATATATNAAAAAGSTAATVASTAVSEVASPAATINYGSNTAVTTSVGNPINITSVASKAVSGTAEGVTNTLKAPTISVSPVKSATIKIPAMTPVKKIVPKTVVATTIGNPLNATKPIVGTSGIKQTSKVF